MLLATATVGACSTQTSKSIWPPEDFDLEAEVLRLDEQGLFEVQKVQVDADGLLIYREAQDQLDAGPTRLPVYTTCAVYELDPRSLRTLARRLDQVDLFDTKSDARPAADDSDQLVRLEWRARGETGSISSRSPDRMVFEDAVRVINAFLPSGREIAYDGRLPGRPEPVHVEATPTPVDSVQGALACHLDLVRRKGDNRLDLLSELFAVALKAGSIQRAEQALDSIRQTLESSEGSDDRLQRKVPAALEALLEEARLSAREARANR